MEFWWSQEICTLKELCPPFSLNTYHGLQRLTRETRFQVPNKTVHFSNVFKKSIMERLPSHCHTTWSMGTSFSSASLFLPIDGNLYWANQWDSEQASPPSNQGLAHLSFTNDLFHNESVIWKQNIFKLLCYCELRLCKGKWSSENKGFPQKKKHIKQTKQKRAAALGLILPGLCLLKIT